MPLKDAGSSAERARLDSNNHFSSSSTPKAAFARMPVGRSLLWVYDLSVVA
jgi:hypothetical protein